MPKGQIFKPRKGLEQAFKDYEFFRRSYEGGSSYRDGNYLIKHPREKKLDYERRQEQASFVNFCGDVVDIYTSYLFREQPERKTESKDEVIEIFMGNADLEGRSWAKTIRGLSKMASYFGAMGVIVDKPKGKKGKSKGAELRAGVRPYIAAYTPLAIWDWKFEKGADGIKRLTELILEEDNDGGPTQVMKWTPEKWELWEKSGEAKTAAFKLDDQGDHDLGEIPFGLLRNRDSFKKMGGVSDISDIAPVNRRIYYLDSDALEIIDGTAFPILEGSAEAIGNKQEIIIGNSSLLKRGEGGVSEAGFRWIEAPHTSLAQILEHRGSSINDIKYMAKTGQSDAQKQQAKSGVALELEFQQLNALLSDKAENAEDFEKRIFELIGKWEGIELGFSVAYPRKFGVRDLHHDLDVALSAKMVVPSRTFAAELGKAFAGKILPKDTDQKTIDKIEKELDQGPPKVGDQFTGEDDEGDTE